MSVKVIVQLYPMLPAEDARDRQKRRPVGRDADAYHQVLKDWAKIAQAAERLGYWGISCIEHHFHSEGYEVGPAPGVINAWLAAQTSRINVGSLGYVIGTQDAIRVAEETAVLDHMLDGRFWVGVARGYQSRWTNILGQHTGGVATLSDGGSVDQQNRRVFEEQMELLRRAWTEETITFDGEYTKVPFPYETGVADYPGVGVAEALGAPGEVVDGAVRRVSVVPTPYQRPHPPIFVSASSSDDSARYCGRHGYVLANFTPIQRSREFAEIYQQESEAAGFPIEFGRNQAVVRWPHVTNSPEEYDEMLRKYDAEIFENVYAQFFKKKLPVGADIIQSIKDSGLFIGGTPEKAREDLVREWGIVPAEYCILIWHWAQQPTESVIEEMERMANEVFPALGGMAPPEERPAAPRLLKREAGATA